MNVIFLDMDGVCNNASYLKWYKARYRKTPHFSFEYTVPYLVERVSRICAECNAFIVGVHHGVNFIQWPLQKICLKELVYPMKGY